MLGFIRSSIATGVFGSVSMDGPMVRARVHRHASLAGSG
jgi:hypothetical protein